MNDAEKKEIEQVFEDTKKVQDSLHNDNITSQQLLHAIPVLLCELYPDKDTMVEIIQALAKQSLILHPLIYKAKDKQ